MHLVGRMLKLKKIISGPRAFDREFSDSSSMDMVKFEGRKKIAGL